MAPDGTIGVDRYHDSLGSEVVAIATKNIREEIASSIKDIGASFKRSLHRESRELSSFCQEVEIRVPEPNHNNCNICRIKFTNYHELIKSTEHVAISKVTSQDHLMIEEIGLLKSKQVPTRQL